jgi:hypothetical protein
LDFSRVAVALVAASAAVTAAWPIVNECIDSARSTSQISRLVDALDQIQPKPLKIALAQTNGNELTLRYAIKIRDAVQQSGIATELGYTIPDDSRERGVIIALRNPSQMPAEAQQIQKALEKA